MSKVGGYKREDGKWVKPATYSRARIEPILAEQGPVQREVVLVQRELHCPNCGAPFVRVTYQEGRVERLLSRVKRSFHFDASCARIAFVASIRCAPHTQAFDRRQLHTPVASIEAQVSTTSSRP